MTKRHQMFSGQPELNKVTTEMISCKLNKKNQYTKITQMFLLQNVKNNI